MEKCTAWEKEMNPVSKEHLWTYSGIYLEVAAQPHVELGVEAKEVEKCRPQVCRERL